MVVPLRSVSFCIPRRWSPDRLPRRGNFFFFLFSASFDYHRAQPRGKKSDKTWARDEGKVGMTWRKEDASSSLNPASIATPSSRLLSYTQRSRRGKLCDVTYPRSRLSPPRRSRTVGRRPRTNSSSRQPSTGITVNSKRRTGCAPRLSRCFRNTSAPSCCDVR